MCNYRSFRKKKERSWRKNWFVLGERVWKQQENEFSALACSFEESELHKLYSSLFYLAQWETRTT